MNVDFCGDCWYALGAMSTLLTIEELRKAYGPHAIFNDASLHIDAKQKIGVIGRNGAGKSTLFKMIVGEEELDSGKLAIQDVARLGYLEQHDQSSPLPVREYLAKLSGKEGWQCDKVAGMFGIKHDMLDAPANNLSGGYQMRLRLAIMLLKDPNLFLLDEPTNYLDVHTQLLLESFLRSYTGAFMIISHDREFLERTCDQTLDVENGKLFLYPGPVSEYLEFKEAQAAYAKRFNDKVDRERKHLQTFVDRFRYKASKAKQAQSKMKAISRLKTVDLDSPLKTVRISIPGADTRKGQVLRVKNMTIGYGEKVVADAITVDSNRGDHVAIIGDNGQGKTTFLKTIAGELTPLSGSFSWAADTTVAYYAQHVPSGLNPLLSAWEYLRGMAPFNVDNETVQRMAGNFLFNKDGLLKKISMLSGGERARLCLAGILLSESQILILDEPTNHLDFDTVEALECALEAFQGTVFFVSHNRSFVNSLATSIIEVGDGKVQRFNGTYDEYVWRLEQSVGLVESKDITIESALPVTIVKHARYEDVKEAKRKLRLIEEAILDFQKMKRKLEDRQAKHPEKFMHSDYTELGNLTTAISDKEEEWLVMQAHIDLLGR